MRPCHFDCYLYVGSSSYNRRVRKRRHKHKLQRETKLEADGSRTRSIGLARALSKMGICSRSQAAVMIQAGRVRLNGVMKRNPEASVHFGVDRIEVDGCVSVVAEKLYWMLNKPRGVVTTAADEKGRRTVYDVLRSALAVPGEGS